MRNHLLAKQRLAAIPTKANVMDLKSAEIGLIDCQDYDMMRKSLIRWGLTENELSEMALVAIEEKGEDLREVVRIHEIRY
ncbi:TIGR03982 family His-Xaa-Ser system protein [Roseibium sp. SCP14]|uniref:TIGR03982 family His-Xaa-Ser system protein n=1 Tax=Roseibium sp. SCP14 TaxID=3141375 RepID=UPI00333907DA